MSPREKGADDAQKAWDEGWKGTEPNLELHLFRLFNFTQWSDYRDGYRTRMGNLLMRSR